MASLFSFLSLSKKNTPLFGKKKFDAKINEKYELLEELGRGGFSEVRVGVELSTKKRYAVKCITKKNLEKMIDGVRNVENEVSILKQIKHRNVIGLVDLVDNKNALYIVMKLVTGGELFDRIIAKGSYTERDACDITKQLLQAMSYIHGLGVVHRDLKPENLLYENANEDANIMVTDFGLSRMVKDLGDQRTHACGTPGYVAPEVLCLDPYGVGIDCWSIGVITYILLCGYPPFYDEDNRNDVVNRQIVRGEYEFDAPYWDDISYEAKDFIIRLLVVEPEKRSTCDDALKHKWLNDCPASRDIYQTVTEHIKKHRARANWKKVVNATNFIERVRRSIIITKEKEDNDDVISYVGNKDEV